MPLVTLEEALKGSVEKGYAIGAFDTADHGFAEAIIGAAEEKNVPVILMLAEGLFGFMKLDLFMPYILDRINRSPVPVVLHLDHGLSYKTCVKAIHYGFSSVMIDGSKLPYAENVALVKKVVEVAHACGVSVEAELGHVAGGEGDLKHGSEVKKDLFTKPAEAKRFVEETNVDALAVAIGTVHGIYKGTPQLELELLRELRETLDIPLVMHGGSGLTKEDFQNAIKCGINKVNFFTEISLASVEAIKEVLTEKEGYVHYPELMAAAFQRAKEVVKEQIEILGTPSLTK
jgi:fructose-bisphosphate aldolase class II